MILPDAVVLALVIVGQYEEEHGVEFLTGEARKVVVEFDEVRESLTREG